MTAAARDQLQRGGDIGNFPTYTQRPPRTGAVARTFFLDFLLHTTLTVVPNRS